MSVLQNMRDPKTTCHVRIIQNNRMPESFDLKMTLYPLKKAELTIVTPNKVQLGSIVQEMKKIYGFSKFAFNVQFNWTNVAKEIQQDAYFKAEIYNIFQNAPSVSSFVTDEQYDSRNKPQYKEDVDPDSLEAYISLVKTHIVDYGNHPDFKVRTDKNQKRIHNYLKSVCGMPNMPISTSMAIADSL